MNSLNELIERCREITDVSKSLMIYAALMGIDEYSLLEDIVADDVKLLGEVLNEIKEFIPDKKGDGTCASCRL